MRWKYCRNQCFVRERCAYHKVNTCEVKNKLDKTSVVSNAFPVYILQVKKENDDEDNIEDIIARIPKAEDVLYKKRQHLPGYPLSVKCL